MTMSVHFRQRNVEYVFEDPGDWRHAEVRWDLLHPCPVLSLELRFSCCLAAALVSTGMSCGLSIVFPWGQWMLD
jgi:hypothetical protein